jgi:hypothetical protein
MCHPKEPEFFCKKEIFARGWRWYESLFANAASQIAIGEASTSYTKRLNFPGTPQRLAKHVPKAKLVYIARDPLERIISHWMLGVLTGWCSSNFKEAVRDSYLIEPSLYWWQICAYRDYFSDEQIFVIFFEDFKVHPEMAVIKCFEFLGVDPSFNLTDAHRPRNVSAKNKTARAFFPLLKRVFSKDQTARLITDQDSNRFVSMHGLSRPRWDDDAWKLIMDQLYEDAEAFLKFYGKSKDFWNLNP